MRTQHRHINILSPNLDSINPTEYSVGNITKVTAVMVRCCCYIAEEDKSKEEREGKRVERRKREEKKCVRG